MGQTQNVYLKDFKAKENKNVACSSQVLNILNTRGWHNNNQELLILIYRKK